MAHIIRKVDYSKTTNNETFYFQKDEELTILISPEGRSFVLDMEVSNAKYARLEEGWASVKVINKIERSAVLPSIRYEVEDANGNLYTELSSVIINE